MKHTVLIFFIFFNVSFSLNAQMRGTFQYLQDGRYYFILQNPTYNSYTVKGEAYSVLRKENKSEVITIAPGGGVYLGPSTPWAWQWLEGDRYTVYYQDGTSQTWRCDVNDYKGAVSFPGGTHGDATPPKSSSDGYIYQGKSVEYNGHSYRLYRKNGHYYIYDRIDQWCRIE